MQRSMRQAEGEAKDAKEQANDMASQCGSLNAMKRKLEAELAALHVRHRYIRCIPTISSPLFDC